MYLDDYKTAISQLCIHNKVQSLYAFGSVLSNRFDAQSDIDLLVAIDSDDPFEYTDYYFNLKFGLQDLMKRPIDLLEEKSFNNEYLKQKIDQSKLLIYAKRV